MSNDLQKQTGSKALTLFDRANAMQVTDDTTCQKAEQMMVVIKTRSNKWIEFWEPMRKAADENKKKILEKINLFSLKATGANQAKTAFKTLSSKVSIYRQEQEHVRREEAEKLQREQIKREEDARIAAAAAAERTGDPELAEAIVEQPVYVAPAKPAEVPQTAGVSYREDWKYQLLSFRALFDAVVAGKAPLQVLQPNDTFLKQQAKAMKTEALYPGVMAYPEKTPQIRT